MRGDVFQMFSDVFQGFLMFFRRRGGTPGYVTNQGSETKCPFLSRTSCSGLDLELVLQKAYVSENLLPKLGDHWAKSSLSDVFQELTLCGRRGWIWPWKHVSGSFVA